MWNQRSRLRNRLLLVLIGILLPLWGFGNLAEEIWEKEEGFPWDLPILQFIHASATPQLDALASTLTQTGGFWGVTLLTTLVAVLLLVRRQRRALIYFLVTLIGNGLINRGAKALLRRVRPNLWVSPTPEFDYGFPSGHAMASMGFVMALVILSWHHPWRWWVRGVGAAYVLMIAWTRLYLGVHYPSDIVAGWMASIAWATSVSLIIKLPDSNSG